MINAPSSRPIASDDVHPNIISAAEFHSVIIPASFSWMNASEAKSLISQPFCLNVVGLADSEELAKHVKAN